MFFQSPIYPRLQQLFLWFLRQKEHLIHLITESHGEAVHQAHHPSQTVILITLALQNVILKPSEWASNLDNPGSDSHPPLALPPLTTAPVPQGTQGVVPSLTPSTPPVSPPHWTAPPPSAVQGHVPSMPPSAPQRKTPVNKTPVSMPVAAPGR